MTLLNKSDLISVEGLTKHLPVRLGPYGQQSAIVHTVDNLTFQVHRSETLGPVGESGCAKATIGMITPIFNIDS